MVSLTLPVRPLAGGSGGEGEGWHTPGIGSFEPRTWWAGAPVWVNHVLALAIIAFLVVAVFWLVAARRSNQKVVPGRFQFATEYVYDFVRDGIAREILGRDFRRYLPLLLAIFSFILVNNLFGLFPAFMFPTFSHIGWAWGAAGLVWIVYNVAGVVRHGLLTYLKLMTIPAGVPWWLLPVIMPIEILSNFIVRPITLGLRLFANLFAGHIVVLVFVTGGAWLLLHGPGPIEHVAGGVSLLFSLAIFALELLVSSLQAYIFTVLTAQYVASATAEDH